MKTKAAFGIRKLNLLVGYAFFYIGEYWLCFPKLESHDFSKLCLSFNKSTLKFCRGKQKQKQIQQRWLNVSDTWLDACRTDAALQKEKATVAPGSVCLSWSFSPLLLDGSAVCLAPRACTLQHEMSLLTHTVRGWRWSRQMEVGTTVTVPRQTVLLSRSLNP